METDTKASDDVWIWSDLVADNHVGEHSVKWILFFWFLHAAL